MRKFGFNEHNMFIMGVNIYAPHEMLSEGIVVNQPTNSVHKLPCQRHSNSTALLNLVVHTIISHYHVWNMTTEKSKILVIGGTGYMGEFIVEGSAKAGNPTFALVREASLSDPVKSKTIQSFKDLGVTILHVCMNSHSLTCFIQTQNHNLVM